MPAALTGAAATAAGAGAIMGGLGSLSSGSFGSSSGYGSQASNWGGANSAYGYNNSISNSENWSNSWENSENWSNSWSDAYNESANWGRTYGREASAQDVFNALSADERQWDMILQQQQYNATEAEKNRLYQMLMSNTAYQRSVADLKKAGLNPILAVGNMGASTPTGSQASSGLAGSHKANAYAEQESGGYSYGYQKSGSSSYGYSKGGSSSYGYSKSQSKAENWASGFEQGSSTASNYYKSVTDNNIRSMAGGIVDGLKNALGNIGSKISNALRNPPPVATH